MIKKVLLPAILGVNVLSAQCVIEGKTSIKAFQEETYTVSRAIGQCEDCHQWTVLGGSVGFMPDNKKNTVRLTANSIGRQVLSVTVLTPEGIAQCSKSIDVLDTNGKPQVTVQTAPIQGTASSDIQVSDYKEVKVSEGIVAFFPNVTDSNYQYSWTVTYFNGEVMTSDQVNPQFPYSKTKGIKTVSVKVNSNRFIKRFSKSYEENYWKFF